MPTTPPTIVAPIPADPRVMTLAKSLGLSRREAFGAAAEAWAWMSVMANDGLVVQAAPDSLDGLVDVAGFGAAMVDAGLVGVVDDGLVLPAELRRLERGGDRPRADVDDDEVDDRRRKGARVRQRRYRARKKLTEPRPQPSPPRAVEPAGPRPQPRSLGSVAGHPVMLLYRRRDGVPFYKLANATPNEFTGSVTDPENPSLEDALTAIHSAMSREAGKPGADGETFRPPLSVVAAAAGIDTSVTDAPAPARAASPAKKLVQKSAPVIAPNPAEVVANTRRPPPPLREGRRIRDDDDAPAAAERDTRVTSVTVTRDSVTVTNLSRENERDTDDNPSNGNGLQSVTSHDPVTRDAPSSIFLSSSSLSQEREEERNSGREPGAATAEHDAALRRRERFERFAAALGISVDAVEHQSRYAADSLFRSLEFAGIDFRTGLPVNADAPSKPSQARPGIDATTVPTRQDEPATGILVAPVTIDHERDDIAAVSPDAGDDAFERSGMTRATTSVACGPL
jgi:hypothetical protein